MMVCLLRLGPLHCPSLHPLLDPWPVTGCDPIARLRIVGRLLLGRLQFRPLPIISLGLVARLLAIGRLKMRPLPIPPLPVNLHAASHNSRPPSLSCLALARKSSGRRSCAHSYFWLMSSGCSRSVSSSSLSRSTSFHKEAQPPLDFMPSSSGTFSAHISNSRRSSVLASSRSDSYGHFRSPVRQRHPPRGDLSASRSRHSPPSVVESSRLRFSRSSSVQSHGSRFPLRTSSG